jgi:pimeloyl-ACP methyl ester carboxylesterase
MAEPAPRPRSTLRKRSCRFLIACGTVYLLVCLGCASFQRRLIYFPPVLDSAQVAELARADKLQRWTSPQGKPIGWTRPSPTQPAAGRVLITHGNACCAFECAHFADPIQQAAPLDVFSFEYPGYADTPGKPTERTLDEAAAEALEALAPGTPVYVVGESLGTGVAAWLAGHYPEKVAGVVLLAPYNSLVDVAQAHVRILPAGLLLRDRFPAQDDLRTYHGPLAVLVGGQDVVVPKRFGVRLYNSYSGPKRLWEFPSATHDSLMFQPPTVWTEIITFVQTNRAAANLSAYVR